MTIFTETGGLVGDVDRSNGAELEVSAPFALAALTLSI